MDTTSIKNFLDTQIVALNGFQVTVGLVLLVVVVFVVWKKI